MSLATAQTWDSFKSKIKQQEPSQKKTKKHAIYIYREVKDKKVIDLLNFICESQKKHMTIGLVKITAHLLNKNYYPDKKENRRKIKALIRQTIERNTIQVSNGLVRRNIRKVTIIDGIWHYKRLKK